MKTWTSALYTAQVSAPYKRVERNITRYTRDARGVIVIVLGNRHGNTSSNPGQDRLHFT